MLGGVRDAIKFLSAKNEGLRIPDCNLTVDFNQLFISFKTELFCLNLLTIYNDFNLIKTVYEFF